MTLRYEEKLIPFNSRFNKKQREKIKRLSKDKEITEAEAVRIMVDAYGTR